MGPLVPVEPADDRWISRPRRPEYVRKRFAVVNANVWTMETPGDRAQALIVDNGRFAFVGEERTALRKAGTAPVIDACGQAVLPGLIDSHTHLIHQGLLQERPDLAGAKSKAEALTRVRAALRNHRRGPLIAERWDESQWRRKEWPTRDELDALTRRHPLVLRRVDGHIAVANTVALRQLHGRLEGVEMDRGLLVEQASLNLNRVWPTPVPAATRALGAAQRQALALGLTTVHDFVTPHYLAAYRSLHRRRLLRLRAHLSAYVEDASQMPTKPNWGDDQLALHGVKAFTDGSLGGHTAALREPYTDEPGNLGRLTLDPAAIRDIPAAATRRGLVPSLHAIGDAAIDHVVAAYRRLSRRQRALRPRIEHYEIHHPEHDAQVQELGLILSMQPNFVGEWGLKGGLYHERLGSTRYRRNNRFATLKKAGARLAFGSDGMPLDPWFGLKSVVQAPFAAQRLPIADALYAYTHGAAYGLGIERDRGSIKKGKTADFIVLDVPTVSIGALASRHVQATIVGGRTEHGVLPTG